MLTTRWRLRSIPGWPSDLDVTVTVDTDASPVVEAIEQAAADNGIDLVRLDEDE